MTQMQAQVQAKVRTRLLRYCAPSPFADRLKQRGADLVYRCGEGHTEPMQSDKYSGELVLTPLALINRTAPTGATTAHAPASILRRAGTELAAARGGDGPGADGGVQPQAPHITLVRGPPLWDDCGAREMGDGGWCGGIPDWDMAAQSAPDNPNDQRTNW